MQFRAKFLAAPLIDVGCGRNIINFPGARGWDKEDGDAIAMAGVPDASYQTVFSSHCLEDIPDAHQALRNWWRILRPGGHLILVMPHRDLYEKSIQLPSKFNGAHRTMWLPTKSQPPCTFSLLQAVDDTCPGHFLMSLRVFDDGNTNADKPDEHANGEFSIELITRRVY